MSENTTSKKCLLCSEIISVAAIKCRHCDGYQGRWFFLNLSAPVLSLFVALISILSLALPTFVSAFDRPHSDVRVAFQYFEDGTAYFVASNGGSRSGSVGEVYLDQGLRGKRLFLRGVASNRSIPPGASKQLTFRLTCPQENVPQVQYSRVPKFGSFEVGEDSRITAVVVQFDGTYSLQTTPLGRLNSVMAINDRMHQCVIAALSANPAR